MVRFHLLISLFFTGSFAMGQNAADTSADKMFIDSINRALDRAVVKKDIGFLQKHYANDFYFLHATGMLDSKQSWIEKSVRAAQPLRSREHDSTSIELHGDVALVSGTLTVLFQPEAK